MVDFPEDDPRRLFDDVWPPRLEFRRRYDVARIVIRRDALAEAERARRIGGRIRISIFILAIAAVVALASWR